MRRRTLSLLAAPVLCAAASQAWGDLAIDSGTASSYYGEIGTGWSTTGSRTGDLNKNRRTSNAGGTLSATWTPGNYSGFAPGKYYTYTNWDIAASLATTNTNTYTVSTSVDGTTNIAVKARYNAAQNAANSMPNADGGGGWYYLGEYTFDADDTIKMERTTGTYLLPDSIYFRSASDGFLIDERSAAVTTTNSAKWTNPLQDTGGTAPSLASALAIDGGADLKYAINITGSAQVQISWGAVNTYDTGAIYHLDLNNNGLQDDGAGTVVTINQRKLADGTNATATGVWSGWYTMGTFDLTGSSKLILTSGSSVAGTRTSADAINIVVPEPGSAMIITVLSGLVALSRRRR